MKIRLNLDALRIESFATGDAPARERGTVHGHARTDRCQTNDCTPATCGTECIGTFAETCQESFCVGTCGLSCGGTCIDSCFCG